MNWRIWLSIPSNLYESDTKLVRVYKLKECSGVYMKVKLPLAVSSTLYLRVYVSRRDVTPQVRAMKYVQRSIHPTSCDISQRISPRRSGPPVS